MKPSPITALLRIRVDASLMDGRRRYSALKELATELGSFDWKSNGLHVLLLNMSDGFLLLFTETVLYGRSCEILARLVLSDGDFFGHCEEHLHPRKNF